MKIIWRISLIGILSGLAAAGLSQFYWGYPLLRPGILKSAKSAINILGVIAVSNWQPDLTDRVHQWRNWSTILKLTKGSPYDSPEGRMLLEWYDRDVLNDAVPLLNEEIAAQAVAFVNSRFPIGDGTYLSTSRNRTGIVAKFDSEHEHGLLLVAIRSGQYRDDHFAYREVVLRPNGGQFIVVDETGFQFDIAGIEGLEFPILFPIFALVGLGLFSITLLGVRFVRIVVLKKSYIG